MHNDYHQKYIYIINIANIIIIIIRTNRTIRTIRNDCKLLKVILTTPGFSPLQKKIFKNLSFENSVKNKHSSIVSQTLQHRIVIASDRNEMKIIGRQNFQVLTGFVCFLNNHKINLKIIHRKPHKF